MPKGAIKYIVGGSLVLLGIIFMLVAFCIGGSSVYTNGVHIELENNNIYLDWSGLHIYPKNYQSGLEGEMFIYDDIKNLKVDFDYGEMTIKTGNVYDIKVNAHNVITERLQYEKDGDTFRIKYDRGFNISFFGGFSPDTKIEIIFPESMTFEDVDINNGAGKMTIEDITADKLTVENGAGEMVMNNVTVTGKLDIDGGVGAITVNDTICGSIDADIGVGQFTYTGEVNGDGRIDSGIGAVYMTLYGDRDDYDFKTDNGIGKITTPGSNSGAKYTFRVSSGIGDVKITIKPKED